MSTLFQIRRAVYMAALSVLALFCACTGKAEETLTTTNEEFQVAQLFTVDGCTVYRFADAGAFRYFARCRTNASIEQSHTEHSGKTTYTSHDGFINTESR